MNKKVSQKKAFRSGMVSIVGRPNVGKSTLLNQILDEKITIVSRIPQTTRNQVRGIYNDDRCQIVFIDTPGLNVSKDRLDQFMNKSAYGTIDDADCIIHLVDSKDAIGELEEQIVERLNKLKVPIILGLNKVDHKGKHMDDYIHLWERVKGQPAVDIKDLTILALSGKEGTNVDKLIDILYEKLPEGPALYPQDAVSDVPQKMLISDLVREKLLMILKQEVPHSIAVIVEDMKSVRGKTIKIRILVLVEKESQKVIVIGKKGNNLKRVGTLARADLEELLKSKVFLEIHVKTKKNWRDNDSLLEEMGYISI